MILLYGGKAELSEEIRILESSEVAEELEEQPDDEQEELDSDIRESIQGFISEGEDGPEDEEIDTSDEERAIRQQDEIEEEEEFPPGRNGSPELPAARNTVTRPRGLVAVPVSGLARRDFILHSRIDARGKAKGK
jgi:hypothetical protein